MKTSWKIALAVASFLLSLFCFLSFLATIDLHVGPETARDNFNVIVMAILTLLFLASAIFFGILAWKQNKKQRR